MQAQADLLQVPVRGVPRRRTRPRSAWPRWPGSGSGQAAAVAEAVGPAEVETVVEPSIAADEAAERLARSPRCRSTCTLAPR